MFNPIPQWHCCPRYIFTQPPLMQPLVDNIQFLMKVVSNNKYFKGNICNYGTRYFKQYRFLIMWDGPSSSPTQYWLTIEYLYATPTAGWPSG